MRPCRTLSSRAFRLSALLCCLSAPAGTDSAVRSEATEATRWRGTVAAPLDGGEQTTVSIEEKTGTTGGVSDGDDWLG
jgi:hypothetical protein